MMRQSTSRLLLEFGKPVPEASRESAALEKVLLVTLGIRNNVGWLRSERVNVRGGMSQFIHTMSRFLPPFKRGIHRSVKKMHQLCQASAGGPWV
jgi:hypothetical protein